MEDNNRSVNSELAAFILDKLEIWRDHRRANYEPLWDEYERIWRGLWSASDKTRQSERSRMVTPMTAIAIDTKKTEIEEGIFGQNLWFDIEDDDENTEDVAKLRAELMKDFKRDKVKKEVALCNTLAEVFGTGVAEIIIEEVPMLQPATEQTEVPGMDAVGVTTSKRKSVKPRPIHPRNFLIDPVVQDINEALGCAIEEFVPIYKVIDKMDSGFYKKCPIETSAFDEELEKVQEIEYFQEDKVLLQRYFGLVPKEYLDSWDQKPESDTSDLEESQEDEALFGEYDDYTSMVEAVVVVCNGHVLYAKENPYMMKDRPLVVYRPEIIPGRFWGRGTVEKAYNCQKAIDGQLRAHLDFTAITTAPMIATDSTRMPRGFKFDIIPGRNIPLQGPPQEILMPITFGQTSPVNAETAQMFQNMLQNATATATPGSQNVSNGTDPAVVSMMMSEIIRKNMNSLLMFQEDFLIPLVEKCAWRYMQFDPDRYPVKDFSFIPISTMGIMAREYEQQQLVGLLQTLGPDSAIVPMVLAQIIANSNLTNKEMLQAQLEQASQPDPQAQQAQMQEQQLQQAILQAQLQKAQADAEKSKADAMLSMAKAQAIPMETQAKLAAALGTNLPNEGGEQAAFEQRLKLMQEETKRMGIQQKDRDMQSNERIAMIQTRQKAHSDAMKAHTAMRKQQGG